MTDANDQTSFDGLTMLYGSTQQICGSCSPRNSIYRSWNRRYWSPNSHARKTFRLIGRTWHSLIHISFDFRQCCKKRQLCCMLAVAICNRWMLMAAWTSTTCSTCSLTLAHYSHSSLWLSPTWCLLVASLFRWYSNSAPASATTSRSASTCPRPCGTNQLLYFTKFKHKCHYLLIR